MNKVLVVEDNPDMLQLLAWQVERLGFLVIRAKNGQEGVEKAVKERPILIFMDIMMPGMDGREAARSLRSKPETREIPIVAATVLFRDSDLRSCIEAGCNDHLVKPFTFEQLVGKVQQYTSVPNKYPT
ncbi:MAG: response regulator [Deltaproteobacteria bacterium]|nr:response regulator [Deltaproteobacteria bacterium]MBI2210931.1 response regulator [Deltaproteobacteria bacterium]MBI2347098.1 response regulator [Deltaproteobacteria bacterium]MBI2539138.1 response regulator [Deltaproteobacteria bacterium]MBI2991103.1 response regulator [Deltaproteobacteria bacterium]